MFSGGSSGDASEKDINTKSSDQPEDTVSCLAWAPSDQQRFLACTSWDSKVRVYNLAIGNNNASLDLKGTMNSEHPPLCVSWHGDMSRLYTGTCAQEIFAYDLQSGKSVQIGGHDGGVKDVYWLDKLGLLCSLSFDKTIKFWDLKSNNSVGTLDLGYKVYCSDLMYPGLMMGLSDERILILNMENIQNYNKNNLDFIESPLGKGSQLTGVAFMQADSGIGACSYDGRANLSYTQTDNNGRIKLNNILTFKCHKVEQGNQSALYPVHDVGFNCRQKSFFFSAGGDGNLYFWDFNAKNKIVGFNYKGTPVTKAKLSPDGNCIAYALGYDYAKGMEGCFSYKTKLCVHGIPNDELVYNGK